MAGAEAWEARVLQQLQEAIHPLSGENHPVLLLCPVGVQVLGGVVPEGGSEAGGEAGQATLVHRDAVRGDVKRDSDSAAMFLLAHRMTQCLCGADNKLLLIPLWQ